MRWFESNRGSHAGAKSALLRFSSTRKTSARSLAPPIAQKVTLALAIHYFKRGHYVSASLLTFCGMRLRCGRLNRMSFYQRYVHRGKVRLTQFFF